MFGDTAMSALDRLADALRRADATWSGGEVLKWDRLIQSEREEWRALARQAAAAVCEEVDGGGESGGGGVHRLPRRHRPPNED